MNCLRDQHQRKVFHCLSVVACFLVALAPALAQGHKDSVAKGDDLPSVVLTKVPLVMMHSVDSNSPVHWDKGKLYLINSAGGHQYVSSGPDIAHLGYRRPLCTW